MIFYVSECLNANSFRRASAITAKSLKSAKMIASKKQIYHSSILTILMISAHPDGNGFILEPIVKKIDGKWQYV